MVKKEDNRNMWILIIIAIAIVLLLIYFKPVSEASSVINNGVAMKAVIVDENNNIKLDLSDTTQNSLSIIAAPTPTGFLEISPFDCVSGCSFLALITTLDNTAGDSVVTVSDVVGTVDCNDPTQDGGCATIPNTLGLETSAGNRRGNLNALYDAVLPTSILVGALASPIQSNGMSLDELAFGLINFTASVTGTFFDPELGSDVALDNVFGRLQLNIASSICSDGTPVDPDSLSDADDIAYCSAVNQGKYCRVGREGQPTLTDRASVCGCDVGFEPLGDVCVATSCTPNSCIAGSVLYCLADGQSVESRCNECGVANCGLDANGQSADRCEPDGTGEPSTCHYPPLAAAGFLIKFDDVSIPSIPECGDGIKSGTEDCDTFDLGGETCTTIGQGFVGGTLSCDASCNYVATSCETAAVNFRTGIDTYDYVIACGGVSPNRWVAYTDTCGNVLKGYGYSGTINPVPPPIGSINCDDLSGGGLTKITDSETGWLPYNPTVSCEINSDGTGIARMYLDGNYLYICENDIDGNGYTARMFKTTDSDAADAILSSAQGSGGVEANC